MSDWSPNSIGDFWDPKTGAIEYYAARLRVLPRDDQKKAFEEIELAATRHVATYSDRTLIEVSTMMVDFLYRSVTGDGAGMMAWLWDFSLAQFLQVTCAPVLGALKGRGYVLRYIIDNCFQPESLLGGPMSLFPDWFNAAGFIYVCRECVAARLMENRGHREDEYLGLLDEYADEATDVATMVLNRVTAERRHYVLIETNGRDELIEKAMQELRSPGTVYVTRREAPGPGSLVALSAPPWFPEQ
jgi:hypothetical protein